MTFWNRQRVVVTGGTGFLGRHVTARLQRLGCASLASLGRADYDLRDAGEAARMYRELAPTLVVHLAARVGGIGANRARPADFFYDNLLMGVHVLDQAWRAGVDKVVMVATVCAYPKLTPIPFRETDLWNGYPEETNAPYGVAKRTVIVQSQAYRQQYGFNSISLLPTNLYGPGDNFDPQTSHVIPALIRKCLEAVEEGRDSIPVWGDGSASRDFLYVDDAAEGILLAAEHYNDSEPVNLGSDDEIAVAEIVRHVAEGVGFSGRIAWDPTKPNGQPRRRVDASRAAERFGFRARTPLDQGLRQTIAWYRSIRAEHAGVGPA